MSDHSISARDISQSVVVTGSGNAVSLSFGASGLVLPLDRKQIRAPDRRRAQAADERQRELDVLNPNLSRLPLVGRDGELADLRDWLDEEPDISVHALTGSAGAGKTRLAIELCAAIDGEEEPSENWAAGFLSPAELGRVAEVYATTAFDWKRSTLLVIDYAGQGYAALGRWLDRLATKGLDVKLRILLLEREAPQGFGWWHELTGSALHSATARRDLFRDASLRPQELRGIYDLEERRRVVTAALEEASKVDSNTADLTIPAAGVDPGYDARLGEEQFANPLSLVMAGVITRERGVREALALRRLDAARHLAGRELDRFRALAGESQARSISHLVAFNGLAGGLPLEKLNRRLGEELSAVGLGGDTGALGDLLQQELPPPPTREAGTPGAPRLATIQPDLIGEGVVIEAFEAASPAIQAEGAATLRRAYDLTGREAAKALMRLLQDYAYALEDGTATAEEKATAERLMTWLTELAAAIDTPEDLEPLAFALPNDTLVLREAALELTQRLADAYKAAFAQSHKSSDAYRAFVWTHNLGARLSGLGRREDALSATEAATALGRALVEADPES